MKKTNLLSHRDESGKDYDVRTPHQWEKRRASILASMQLVMGNLPGTEDSVDLDITILESDELPEYIRHKISYSPEPGDRVPAYLLIPHNLDGKAPAMLCLHQTTSHGKAEPAGVAGLPNLHYAAHLASRGYVTIAPDYSLGGSYTGEYRIEPTAFGYTSGTMKGIWNHMRAVDVLETLPEVDTKRIGCIGHSLGGHNTLFVGAFDQRLKVLISSCGYSSFFKYDNGDLRGWSQDRYMPRIADVYGNNPSRMPFDFSDVVAALAPRPFFTNAPLQDDFDVEGVRDCIDAAMPVYELFQAGERLTTIYPDCGHDFPDAVRESAYRWLDQWMKTED